MSVTLTTEPTERERLLEEEAGEEEQEEELCANGDCPADDPWEAVRRSVQRGHYFMTQGFA